MQAPTESGQDPRLKRSYFEREAYENDDLGLSDMKTEFVEGEWRTPAALEAAVAARREAQGSGGGGAAPRQRRARASHILVTDAALCAELKRRLEEEEGASFSALAHEHSTCPSSAQGGLLGSFAPGKMVPAFDEVIFGTGEVGVVQVSRLLRFARRAFAQTDEGGGACRVRWRRSLGTTSS